MESLGDFEQVNDFEFDLSDVDVAAFESVATEDTTNTAATTTTITTTTTTTTTTSSTTINSQPQEQQLSTQEHPEQPQSPQSNKVLQQTAPNQQQSQSPEHTPQQQLQILQPASQQQQQSQQQQPHYHQSHQTHHSHPTLQHQQITHVTQLTTASGTPSGKILLVPINAKPGTTNFKHLLQLPAGSAPLTMGAITTGNKKQMIQLAPLSASNLNLSKNNYSFPIATATTTATSAQLLPGSSQGQRYQQLYLTTATAATATNDSIRHQQALSLNSVLSKSLSNLQNSTSLSNLPSANLSARNVPYNDNLRASTPTSTIANEVPKRKACNCTKSQCLKLYCDCFANGEFCSGCNCTNCFNSLSKEKERQKAISQCLERNPEAFRPKIGKTVKSSIGEPAPDSFERRHTKGCNCKRSGCLKNYCECYEAKILCSNLCKCCGCKNYEESFERKSLMQLTNSTSENARGILKSLLPTNTSSNTGKEFTKCFITDKVIRASLVCLLQTAQQAEKDGIKANNIPNLIQAEMGKCLRMIVDSASESSSPKKR